MVEEANLRAESDGALEGMLKELMRRMETLTSSAIERLKQSETAEWDDGLYQGAMELLAEAGRLSEQGDLIAKEFEYRYGQAALYGDREFSADNPWRFDQRWYRKNLTTRTVPWSRDIDELLPPALENLLSQVPPSWWAHQRSLVSKVSISRVIRPGIFTDIRPPWGVVIS